MDVAPAGRTGKSVAIRASRAICPETVQVRASQSMTSSPEPGNRTVYGVAPMRKVACPEPERVMVGRAAQG